eukprot:m.406418 g.406418  ORF g.406418 m.406418 type:complete len:661 (+) comp56494_c0_seq12:965-2947(+)
MGVFRLTSFVENKARVYYTQTFSRPLSSAPATDASAHVDPEPPVQSVASTTQDQPAFASVVIDGGSLLFHFLAEQRGITYFQGGYRLLEDSIRQFFAVIQHVFADVLVVFDGYDASRIDVRFDRLQQRLDDTRAVFAFVTQNEISTKTDKFGPQHPSFASQVLKAELERLRVPFRVAFGEADLLVADEASKRNAVVMSTDSDFYIFDIPAYIPLKSLRLNVAEKSFSASVFRRPALAKYLKVEPSFLPTLAAVLTNDRVPLAVVQAYHVFLKRSGSADLIILACKHLGGLSRENAISAVLKGSPRVHREENAATLRQSIMMHSEPGTFVHGDFFSFVHPSLRERFKEQYSAGRYSSSLVSIRHGLVFSCAVTMTNPSERSPHDSAASLRRRLFAMIHGDLAFPLEMTEYNKDVRSGTIQAVSIPVWLEQADHQLLAPLKRMFLSGSQGSHPAAARSTLSQSLVSVDELLAMIGLESWLTSSTFDQPQLILPASALLHLLLEDHWSPADALPFIQHIVCTLRHSTCDFVVQSYQAAQAKPKRLLTRDLRLVAQWQVTLEVFHLMNQAVLEPLDSSVLTVCADGVPLHARLLEFRSLQKSRVPLTCNCLESDLGRRFRTVFDHCKSHSFPIAIPFSAPQSATAGPPSTASSLADRFSQLDLK